MNKSEAWRTWRHEELYPALYEEIDRVFPEFQFKRKGTKWISTNKRKLSGDEGGEVGKVEVWDRTPGQIKDWREGSTSIVDYYIKTKGVDILTACKDLGDIVGISLPKGDFSEEEVLKWGRKSSLLEDANSYFTKLLKEQEGEEVRKYLQDRGYTEEEVLSMELGFTPPVDRIKKQLLKSGYTEDEISDTLKLNSLVGDKNCLSIPWRSGTVLKGFIFRSIEDGGSKYIYTTGLEKNSGFFNLKGIKGDKDLLIVEGVLDALHGEAKGLQNVVATGSSSLSKEQIKDAISKGAKSFTICLDTEPGRETKTAEIVKKAIKDIEAEGVSEIFVLSLPDLNGVKTDLDSYLKTEGIDTFRRIYRHGESLSPYYLYLLQDVLNKYSAKEEEEGESYRILLSFLEEAVVVGSSIKNYLHRDLYREAILKNFKDLGVTEDSLKEAVSRLVVSREKEEQKKEFSKLVGTLTDLHGQDKTEDAIQLLQKETERIKSLVGSSILPAPISFEALLTEIVNTKDGKKTGYTELDKKISIKSSATTLIGGRTGHGKTAFMLNLLLNMSSIYPTESFYFFSFEEPVKNIFLKLLSSVSGKDLSFVSKYIKEGRTDISEIEEAKTSLKEKIDSRRVVLIGENYSVEDLDRILTTKRVKEERISVVFLDYIQRMKTEQRTQDLRTTINAISDGVLQIAKGTGISVIAGAQLSRETDTKGSHRVENLKESGNLEEDANLIITVYNEAREKPEENFPDPVSLEIKVLKNREGEVNTKTVLYWNRPTWRIEN
jgi:DNA primase